MRQILSVVFGFFGSKFRLMDLLVVIESKNNMLTIIFIYT